MGKAKKIKVSRSEMKQPKMALSDQIEKGKIAKSKNRQKNRVRKEDDDKVIFVFFNFLRYMNVMKCNIFEINLHLYNFV